MSLEAQLRALPGDVALASAFMSYAGPFPSQYREDLAKHTWQKQVPTLHAPFTALNTASSCQQAHDHTCYKHTLVGIRS